MSQAINVHKTITGMAGKTLSQKKYNSINVIGVWLFLSTIQLIFLIALLGYLAGSIKIAGLQLGTSAVLLVALVFGHFGYDVPVLIRDFGLACFVGSVGLIAGPAFFRSFQKQAAAYIMIGPLAVAVSSLVAVVATKLFHLPVPLGVGLLAGALSSTPGLAAALEATGNVMTSVGYGIAYPFGVVGVVLFVQLVPKLERVNIPEEVRRLVEEQSALASGRVGEEQLKLRVLEPSGLMILAAVMVLGLLISSVIIPLPGGVRFSLGISGGPLLAGLLIGHLGRIGNISLRVAPKTLETLRELGLALFLIGAGTGAGKGFVEVVQQQGPGLFLIGAVITVLPMLVGYYIVRKVFALSVLNSLGAICGGMTSTPALGSLISVAQSELVAAAYAAAYPVALISVVLACQFVALLM